MKKPNPTLMAQMGLLLGATLLAVGCGGSSSSTPDPCASLTGMKIPATAIGLATTGGTITSAKDVSAAASAVGTTTTTPFGTMTTPGAGVEYCKAVGVINPVDATAQVINFEVDLPLPAAWNHKTLHEGGGGMDGSIPTLDFATANGITSPIARGYAMVGDDSGHSTTAGLLTDEGIRNFGREAIKKTHDAAIAVIQAYYGTAPQFNYFMGGSQGGHESLIAANFYPYDFDGAVVGFPAYDLGAMHTGALDWSKAVYNDHTAADGYKYNTVTSTHATAGYGWISRPQQENLKAWLVNACDTTTGTVINDYTGTDTGKRSKLIDGAKDGVLSDPGACRAYIKTQGFDLLAHDTTNPLRCQNYAGTESVHVNDLSTTAGVTAFTAETCLSDVQIETLKRVTSRYDFPTGLTLEGGLVSYAKWPVLDGATMTGYQDFGTSPTSYDSFQLHPATDEMQLYAQKTLTNADILAFDLTKYLDRAMTVSSQVDTSNVDYEAFRGRGGKIIHYHGNQDVSITTYNSIDLYLRMTGQFYTAADQTGTPYIGDNRFWKFANDNGVVSNGLSSDNLVNSNASVSQNTNVPISGGIVNDFYQFYVLPGYGHGGGYYNASADWLTALENWREKGVAPQDTMTMMDTGSLALGTRPVCHFPYYPKFTSTTSTDTTKAANYTCTKLYDFANLR